MRILIAEDDAVPRMILKIAVEKFGHACLVAEDGSQAWDMYQNASVNVVIIAMSSLTEPKLPRRIAWRVRMPNQVSIWFIQDAEVGVKWKVIRG